MFPSRIILIPSIITIKKSPRERKESMTARIARCSLIATSAHTSLSGPKKVEQMLYGSLSGDRERAGKDKKGKGRDFDILYITFVQPASQPAEWSYIYIYIYIYISCICIKTACMLGYLTHRLKDNSRLGLKHNTVKISALKYRFEIILAVTKVGISNG